MENINKEISNNVIQFPLRRHENTVPVTIPPGSKVDDVVVATMADDSLKCWGIYEGDALIIDQGKRPENGDFCRIDLDGQMLARLVYFDGGNVTLKAPGTDSRNDYECRLSDVAITGVVIAHQRAIRRIRSAA